jgi:hypothetical protein
MWVYGTYSQPSSLIFRWDFARYLAENNECTIEEALEENKDLTLSAYQDGVFYRILSDLTVLTEEEYCASQNQTD